jgi:hypothetical protein
MKNIIYAIAALSVASGLRAEEGGGVDIQRF